MAAFFEYSDVSDVIHTMSKEHNALHMEEDYPPPDLAAGVLSIIGKTSS